MLEVLFDELAEEQRKKLMAFGRVLVPGLTADDLLQPNDFPILDNHLHFRYEEGVLEGILTARMAYLSWKKDQEKEE